MVAAIAACVGLVQVDDDTGIGGHAVLAASAHRARVLLQVEGSSGTAGKCVAHWRYGRARDNLACGCWRVGCCRGTRISGSVDTPKMTHLPRADWPGFLQQTLKTTFM